MKPRVLIFEDNDILRSTLKKLLVGKGYEVYAFSNPGMCPQYYASKHSCLLDNSCTDIIISDVNMPVESGLEWLDNCRKLIKNQRELSGWSAGKDKKLIEEIK